MMNFELLKDQLLEQIGDAKVKAVLFHTFNFDPRFFENYVLPIFIKEAEFGNEVIRNNILLRRYISEGNVPPITVYCDFFAKSQEAAPNMGYEVRCVRLPEKPGHICNFHPKQIFLLLQKGGVETLLVVTGSGNLTQNGWSENLEVFSCLELKRHHFRPRSTNTNLIERLINQTCSLSGNNDYSLAEIEIMRFLPYTQPSLPGLFHSLENSLWNFLKGQIQEIQSFESVEIISPYFSIDNELLKNFQQQNLKVKCLLPKMRNGEAAISKETMAVLRDAGVEWCRWKSNNKNLERALHAKIYRFLGPNSEMTVVGSVNFTNPGTIGFNAKGNTGNVEAAEIHHQTKLHSKPDSWFESMLESELEQLSFIDLQDIEFTEGQAFHRNPPDLVFTLDWKEKTLRWTLGKEKRLIRFFKLLNQAELHDRPHTRILKLEDLRKLSRNALIEIEVKDGEVWYPYSFFPIQINVLSKPLEKSLSIQDILAMWNSVDSDVLRSILVSEIAEIITDASGIVDSSRLERMPILNELASHFNGIIQLERRLFAHPIDGKKLEDIFYYLLTENIDTLPHYLKLVQEQVESGKLPKTLFWFLIQIASIHFYNNYKTITRTNAPRERLKEVAEGLQKEAKRLKDIAEVIETSIPGLPAKSKWLLNELKKEA